MAKKSIIQRELKRKKQIKKYKNKRLEIKEQIKKAISYDEKMQLNSKFQKLPRNSAKCRQKNRCWLTGRSRSFYRDFGLSRHALREMAHNCLLPGVIKSNYQMSNLYSVFKAVEQVNGIPKIISDPKELQAVSKIILPGVGSFDSAIKSLEIKGFIDPLKKYIKNGMPFLGICLGLQLLMLNSEEGQSEGLGILEGKVKKFDKSIVKIVPHIGWNKIQIHNYESPLWINFDANLWFYFIHSYYVHLDDDKTESAYVKYGNLNFTAAISIGNIMAVQFHPEKSSNSGLSLLKNFTNIS
eukprot:jgi/Galph1/4599/GphlegSOOS_G3302.1